MNQSSLTSSPPDAFLPAVNHPATLASLGEAFAQYEHALTHNTVEVLDTLFWNSPHTLRFGVRENLLGTTQIQAFRAARPGVGLAREILTQHLCTFGELPGGTASGVANITFRRTGEPRCGRQSQSWVYFAGQGWRVVAAHVSWMDV